MKTFKQFMSETPNMSGPVGPNNPAMAGYVPKLFAHDTTPTIAAKHSPAITQIINHSCIFILPPVLFLYL